MNAHPDVIFLLTSISVTEQFTIEIDFRHGNLDTTSILTNSSKAISIVFTLSIFASYFFLNPLIEH